MNTNQMCNVITQYQEKKNTRINFISLTHLCLQFNILPGAGIFSDPPLTK